MTIATFTVPVPTTTARAQRGSGEELYIKLCATPAGQALVVPVEDAKSGRNIVRNVQNAALRAAGVDAPLPIRSTRIELDAAQQEQVGGLTEAIALWVER